MSNSNFSLTYGDRIKAVRLSHNLSLKQFCNYIGDGVTRAEVSKWESCKHFPSPKRAKKIADMCNLSVEYLEKGSSIFNESDWSLFEHNHLTQKEESKVLEITFDEEAQLMTEIYKCHLEFKKTIKQLLNPIRTEEVNEKSNSLDSGFEMETAIINIIKLFQKINFANRGEKYSVYDKEGICIANNKFVRKRVQKGTATTHTNPENFIAGGFNDLLIALINYIQSEENDSTEVRDCLNHLLFLITTAKSPFHPDKHSSTAKHVDDNLPF